MRERLAEAEPAVIERGEQPYVGIRQNVSMRTIGRIADRIPDVLGWLASHGVPADGAPFLRYHVVDGQDRLEVEAGVPVGETITPPAGDVVAAGVLPGGTYVVSTHRGPFEQLAEVTTGLLAWASQQGLRWDVSPTRQGELWACRLEIYHTNPIEHPDPADWETTLAFKLAT